MALRDYWINSNLELFRIDKNNSIFYLNNVTLAKIWWLENGKGRCKLEGWLSICKELNRLETGDTLHILHRVAGRKDEYDPSLIAAILSDIEIKRKWMLNINPASPDNQEVTLLYISLICKVELLT